MYHQDKGRSFLMAGTGADGKCPGYENCRYIDDIVFIWTHGERKLQNILEKLNKYHPKITFTG